MGRLVILLFIFFIGSVFGWCLELVFRRFFSGNNPEHRWINPGFLMGPYLPIYGFGLMTLYLLASIPIPDVGKVWQQKLILFIVMAVAMTVIEYIAGIIFIKGMHVRLWDYSKMWGNLDGIICPLFSFFWALLGAAYYFFIHPHILDSLEWLSQNLTFCLVIGFFYGVFTIDVVYSIQLVQKIRQYAEEKQVVVKYELLKANIRKATEEGRERGKEKIHFLLAFQSAVPLREHLEKYVELMQAFHDNPLAEVKEAVTVVVSEATDAAVDAMADIKEGLKERIGRSGKREIKALEDELVGEEVEEPETGQNPDDE